MPLPTPKWYPVEKTDMFEPACLEILIRLGGHKMAIIANSTCMSVNDAAGAPKGKLDRRNGGGDVEKCPASCEKCLVDQGKGGREHEIEPGRTKIGNHDVDMGVLDLEKGRTDLELAILEPRIGRHDVDLGHHGHRNGRREHAKDG